MYNRKGLYNPREHGILYYAAQKEKAKGLAECIERELKEDEIMRELVIDRPTLNLLYQWYIFEYYVLKGRTAKEFIRHRLTKAKTAIKYQEFSQGDFGGEKADFIKTGGILYSYTNLGKPRKKRVRILFEGEIVRLNPNCFIAADKRTGVEHGFSYGEFFSMCFTDS